MSSYRPARRVPSRIHTVFVVAFHSRPAPRGTRGKGFLWVGDTPSPEYITFQSWPFWYFSKYREALRINSLQDFRQYEPLAPLVVQEQAEPLATASGYVRQQAFIRITVYPIWGAWLRRWQSLCVVHRDEYHHRPVYSLQRHQRRVACGSIGLKCAC